VCEAAKPRFCTEASEKNLTNIWLLLEVMASGFLLPQNRPKMAAEEAEPS